MPEYRVVYFALHRLARVALTGVLCAAASCTRPSKSVPAVPDIPYPTCPSSARQDETPSILIDLRAGSGLRQRWLVEHFRSVRRACLWISTARIERGYDAQDIEIVYDENGTPLRAWKRVTLPYVSARDGDPEIQRYELRSDPVTLKQRRPGGEIAYRALRGERPRAVIGAGRAALTMWIRRAHLEVRAQVREWVLDLERGRLDQVTLRRHEDAVRPDLGRVRVYTVFGRDPVFTDDSGNVVGDLEGLVLFDKAPGPAPPPMERYGTIDPVQTP